MRTDKLTLGFAYLRLSNEEAQGGESSSITNQRMIVQNYCKQNGITLVREFVDASRANDIVPFFYHTTLDWYQESFENDFDGYLEYLRQMEEEFGLENDVKLSALSRYPEVFAMEEAQPDEDGLWKAFEKALRGAVKELDGARAAEGANLQRDLTEKLDQMLGHVAFIEARSPQIVAEYRAKLEDKMKELLADTQIEENRIASEVILFADKICTDEEVVRLKSHISHMRNTLEEKDEIGRKLDFIAQEMNREANTILSKANDIEVSDRAISLKTEIEKIREQIQNIE